MPYLDHQPTSADWTAVKLGLVSMQPRNCFSSNESHLIWIFFVLFGHFWPIFRTCPNFDKEWWLVCARGHSLFVMRSKGLTKIGGICSKETKAESRLGRWLGSPGGPVVFLGACQGLCVNSRLLESWAGLARERQKTQGNLQPPTPFLSIPRLEWTFFPLSLWCLEALIPYRQDTLRYDNTLAVPGHDVPMRYLRCPP